MVATSALVAAANGVARADCIDDAATYHHVNALVLRAIAQQESSFRSNIVTRNTNGSVDIGMFGTNSIHLPDLATVGVGPDDLKEPCVAAYVAAWMYRKKIVRHGNTWTAVGAYHSETPRHRDRYAQAIHRIVQSYLAGGAAAQGPLTTGLK